MTGTCLCGAVRVTIDARPEFINDCNCSLCRKAGAAWGYFPSASVTTAGSTLAFSRTDKTAPAVAVHSCSTCAATTHFVLTEAFRAGHPDVDVVGVNMRLFDPTELDGVELRFPNGRDWAGEGPYDFRRPAMTIGASSPW
jgi:hypothetical protein